MARAVEEPEKNEWVHLTPQGLTTQRLVSHDLKHPECVDLSACRATVGNEESLHEAIHLAVGTMWAVDDAETNKITSTFHEHMMDESAVWITPAQRRTMESVGDYCNVPLDQRILYIHHDIRGA